MASKYPKKGFAVPVRYSQCSTQNTQNHPADILTGISQSDSPSTVVSKSQKYKCIRIDDTNCPNMLSFKPPRRGETAYSKKEVKKVNDMIETTGSAEILESTMTAREHGENIATCMSSGMPHCDSDSQILNTNMEKPNDKIRKSAQPRDKKRSKLIVKLPNTLTDKSQKNSNEKRDNIFNFQLSPQSHHRYLSIKRKQASKVMYVEHMAIFYS